MPARSVSQETELEAACRARQGAGHVSEPGASKWDEVRPAALTPRRLSICRLMFPALAPTTQAPEQRTSASEGPGSEPGSLSTTCVPVFTH